MFSLTSCRTTIPSFCHMATPALAQTAEWGMLPAREPAYFPWWVGRGKDHPWSGDGSYAQKRQENPALGKCVSLRTVLHSIHQDLTPRALGPFCALLESLSSSSHHLLSSEYSTPFQISYAQFLKPDGTEHTADIKSQEATLWLLRWSHQSQPCDASFTSPRVFCLHQEMSSHNLGFP
jgi:hypothetical protein